MLDNGSGAAVGLRDFIRDNGVELGDLVNNLITTGEVVTKKELLVDVWHQAWGGSDKTVDVHLSWLRRKLGETAAQPRMLRTIRGVGVMLVPPS